MDVGAFVQENKRWLIGCALGVVVFLIGRVVVASIWDPLVAEKAYVGQMKAAGGTEMFDRNALSALNAEGEQLAAERQRLQRELSFQPADRYVLTGKGAPEEYLAQVGRQLRRQIMTAANERGIALLDKDLGWPSANSIDDIKSVLFGLDLIDQVAQRLFAAHDARRVQDQDAVGVRAITALRIEERRGQRGQMQRVRPGEVDLRDHIEHERAVTLWFQGDAPTALSFVESCRQPGRALLLDTCSVQAGGKAGDPLQVKLTLTGVAFKAPAVGER